MHIYLITLSLPPALNQAVWDARKALPKDYSSYPKPHITLLRLETQEECEQAVGAAVKTLAGQATLTPRTWEHFGGGAVVLTYTSERAKKHHSSLLNALQSLATTPLRYVGVDYKPHLTFCYAKKMPELLPEAPRFSGVAQTVEVAKKRCGEDYVSLFVHSL